ncbi:MAG: ATPase, T2SS/T4P/T4SS family [bacterium]
MELTDKNIREVLIEGAYVAEEDMQQSEKASKAHHTSLMEELLMAGLVTKDLLGQAVAEHLGIIYADLNSHQPPREQVLKIPEVFAKKYKVVLFQEEDKTVTITSDSPEAKGLQKEIEKLFKGKKIIYAYSLSDDIDLAFVHYRKALETRFSKIIKKQNRVAPEILEEILDDAVIYRASDIHFEPQEIEVVIRFRIDGILEEAGRVAKEYYEGVLNRIKVQSHLRTDEHFTTQDGAIRRVTERGHSVDLRVSIIPTIDGEKVVMRLLAAYVRGFTMSDVGLGYTDQKKLLDASHKPFGMILVTGPTGSGKTTTLYSVLKLLNRPEVNVTTIEDPVEYKIQGVNHIQVNEATGLTFTKGLRSIVRQDPDIILVGEIRDLDTAEIAVNAALTGHLLLSTFHANDASTSVPRLLDMGIEPFLLASTLELIIAQRLVRRLCENCRYSKMIDRNDLKRWIQNPEAYFPQEKITVYEGKGCNVCNETGFKGRIAIFEFIQTSPEIQDLILSNPSTKQLWDLAKSQGAHSLFEDGIEKVKQGITTVQELLRVAAPHYFKDRHDDEK